VKSSALPYWLTLFVVLGIAYGGWKVWQIEQQRQRHQMKLFSSSAQTGPALTEFTLTERSGQPFHSRDLRGKVWAGSYFFSKCPGPCKRMNEGIASLASLDELADVRFISITCDPTNDTPERLADYADSFQADPEQWLFCTGEMDYLQRVGQDILKLSVKLQGHNQNLMVVDRAGQIRGTFDLVVPTDLRAARELMLICLAEDVPAASEIVEDTGTDGDSTDEGPEVDASAAETSAQSVAPTSG